MSFIDRSFLFAEGRREAVASNRLSAAGARASLPSKRKIVVDLVPDLSPRIIGRGV